MQQKSRERTIRRRAERLGWVLRKSRRDGTWWIIDPNTDRIVAGTSGSRETEGWTLEEIEKYIADAEQRDD